MKFICYITTLIGIQGAVPALAAVTMISVEHRVWGDAGESPVNSYEESGSGSLSRNISHYDMTAGYYASSSSGDWSVEAFRTGDAYYCNGFAQNTYRFTPLSAHLTITLRGRVSDWWFANDAQMMLTDLSSNSLVSSYQSPSYFYPLSPFPPFTDDMVDYPINWDETLVVDPAHEYELILFVGAHRGEGGHGLASLDLTLAPEPGTALLAGVAVLLMCGRRRRAASSLPHVPDSAKVSGCSAGGSAGRLDR